MQQSQVRRPKRTSQEENVLVDELVQTGKTRCYFCNIPLDPQKDEGSTEFGGLYACHACYFTWGNPDRDPLPGEDGQETG